MNKISALIKLIEDPDEQIFSQVRNEILSMGAGIIPNLEDALLSAPNADSAERISDILCDIQYEDLQQNFVQWMGSEEQDLLELMILIEQIRDYSFSKQQIIEQIAQLKMAVWLELNENQTILEKIKIINSIFYTQQNFSADEEEPYALNNYFMGSVLGRKKGNDTSLGVLYLYIAQTQKIPFWGVKLLSNFILAYTQSEQNKAIDDVLFYLNPYKKGVMFSLMNLLEFFSHAGVELNIAEITPCTNIDIARRWMWFIQQAYIRKGDEKKLVLVNNLLKLFINS